MLTDKSARPWYFAITASAGIHFCLVVAASWIVIDSKAWVRPADFDCTLAESELPEGLQPTLVNALELSPGRGDRDRIDHGLQDPGSTAPFDQLAPGPSRLAPHLSAAAPSLMTRWLSDSRSAKGLTDVVGPVVFGADGNPENSGGTASGVGNGSGQKASFFGVRTDARRIVYVVDASKSMNRPYGGEAKTRFGQMKLELAKSILGLSADQQFFIIFFNEHANPMPAGGLEYALPQNQQKYLSWVASIPAYGLTDPRPSLSLAFSLNPDVVYLLTDGTFPRDVQSDLGMLRQKAIQINTIAFGDPKAEKSLKPLALKNRGRFAFVP